MGVKNVKVCDWCGALDIGGNLKEMSLAGVNSDVCPKCVKKINALEDRIKNPKPRKTKEA